MLLSQQIMLSCLRRIGWSAILCGAALFAQTPTGDSFLLRGATVHTISGAVIENGSVLIRSGKIVGVGRNLAAPEGTTVIDLQGKHVYPGMIDAGAMLGLEKPAGGQASDEHEL